MSDHHSNKSIQLHHRQVDAARERRQLEADARMQYFLGLKHRFHMEHNFVLVCSFVFVAYINLATAVYLGWII